MLHNSEWEKSISTEKLPEVPQEYNFPKPEAPHCCLEGAYKNAKGS